MPQTPKYITVNGVMKKNPDYHPDGAAPSKAAAAASAVAPLAIVSSIEDVMAASEIQMAKTGLPVPMAQSTTETIEMMQDEEMLLRFKSKQPLDGGVILDSLGAKFAQYETPLGMVNKLMMLTEYKLDFLVDDSGSMASATDVEITAAGEFMQQAIAEQLRRAPRPGEKMTRLQEAEDRLHTMVGLLAYIPVEHMQIRFLNSKEELTLVRTGKTPEQFEAYAHDAIRRQFSRLKSGSTPVKAALSTGFNLEGKWSHYFFNDGEPDEGGENIAHQIRTRKNPELHPLTLISCTNEDGATDWMKHADTAPYVAELDDFNDERDEVLKNQGPAFSYTRGLWMLSQLVASINPYDLDALDENLPLTNYTLSNIYGRKLNPREYQYYFENNPHAALYVKEYKRFLTEENFAKQIISSQEQLRREESAGYLNGERCGRPLANISAKLGPITEEAYTEFAKEYADPAQKQASAASLAPHSSFMPAPAAGALYPPQAAAYPPTQADGLLYPPPADYKF